MSFCLELALFNLSCHPLLSLPSLVSSGPNGYFMTSPQRRMSTSRIHSRLRFACFFSGLLPSLNLTTFPFAPYRLSIPSPFFLYSLFASTPSAFLSLFLAVQRKKTERGFSSVTYESPMDDHDELSVQFGYITLFAVAFPLAPLLGLCQNMVESKVDRYKLTHVMRRPQPKGCETIGTWYVAVHMMRAFLNILFRQYFAEVSEDR